MKPSGLFSFVLVLLFIHTSFIVTGMNIALLEEYGEAGSYLLQMENANFARVVIEENVDYLISRTMEMELERRNTEPLLIKGVLFRNLGNFFSGMEESYSQTPHMEFKLSRFDYSGRNLNNIPRAQIADNFNVLVVNAGEKIFLAEFSYTGGLLKDKRLYAVISYPGYEQLFFIPLNYSVKVLKVVA